MTGTQTTLMHRKIKFMSGESRLIALFKVDPDDLPAYRMKR